MFDVGDRIIGLELPDTFYKLAELLEQDQFELLLSKNRIKDMHRKQDISLVYLMNDAVESFLVFHNATITGQYKSEYEGGLLAVLDKKEEEYVLVVHQGDSVITLFFEDLLQQNNLYNYGDLGHFWVKGYEYLRLLEYRLAILRDKCDYLDIDCSTPEERKLAALVEFPPLNYCCYPAVPEKYIVPRQNPWQPSDEAIDLMIEIAKEAGDKLFVHILSYYKKDNSKLMSRFIARMLHRKKHIKIVRILTKKLQKAASIYPVRSFGIENDIQIQKCLEKAKQKKQELKEKGIKADIIREEPFVEAQDSVQFDSKDEQKIAKELFLLTSKPVMYVCNVDEASAATGNKYVEQVREAVKEENAEILVVAAKTEADIAELETYEDRQMFLQEVGLKESGVNRLIKSAYHLLELETFITAGEMEVKAWTYRKGWKAPQCAGVIHTDFEKGFIRAEVIKYEDYIKYGSEAAVKEAGKMGVEGKEYVVQDGDIMHFRFNV